MPSFRAQVRLALLAQSAQIDQTDQITDKRLEQAIRDSSSAYMGLSVSYDHLLEELEERDKRLQAAEGLLERAKGILSAIDDWKTRAGHHIPIGEGSPAFQQLQAAVTRYEQASTQEVPPTEEKEQEAKS
jgi:hypothetical protein